MTGPAFEVIVAALEGRGHRVRRHGAYASTTCTHDGADNPQGLSVFDNGSRVKLTCFTRGCDGKDIVESIGLTLRDLYHDPHTRYEYDDGRTVHRDTAAKGFRQSGNTAGSPTLYRRSKVDEAVTVGRTIYLVEGEEDVHSLEAIGQIATTGPMGASSFRRVDIAPLRDADVVAIPDGDEQGSRWAEVVKERLDGVVNTLRFAHPKTGKDASDHIAAGGTVDDLLYDDPDRERREALLAKYPPLNLDRLLDPNRPPREYVINGLLPAGTAISLAAPAGTGKSLLALGIALSVAGGSRKFAGLGIPRPRRVVYIDMENTADDLAERFESFGVRQGDDLGSLTYLSLPELPPLDTLEGGSELLAVLGAYRHGPGDLLVLDSLQRVIRGEENSADTMRMYYLCTGMHLKRAGYTSLRLDNTGKDTTRGSRGTSGKRDDVDLELVMLQADEDDEDRFEIKINKSRLSDIPNIMIDRFVDKSGLLRFSTDGDPFRNSINNAQDEMDKLGLDLNTSVIEARKALQHRHFGEKTLRVAVRERRGYAIPRLCASCGLPMSSIEDAATHPTCQES